MSHLMTRNHHLEIEGGMLASASPGVVKNVTGYDARISSRRRQRHPLFFALQIMFLVCILHQLHI